MRLETCPLTRDEANAFVGAVHRHHGPVVGHRFAIGAELDGQLVGVAIVGRTKARALDDRYTAEVTRLATDGTRNACSFLYGACWRAWRTMGGRTLVTYTLASEPGSSLRAAGFVQVATVRGREHDTPTRRRAAKGGAQLVAKVRWERVGVAEGDAQAIQRDEALNAAGLDGAA